MFTPYQTGQYFLWNYITPYASLQVTADPFSFRKVTFNVSSYLGIDKGLAIIYEVLDVESN